MPALSPFKRFVGLGVAWLAAMVFNGPLVAGEFYTLKGHGGPVMGIAVSPTSGMIATASFDNSIGMWARQEPRWLDTHSAAVNVVEFIDDNRAVSAGDDFSLVLWDLQTGEGKRLAGHKGKVMGLAVSPDRKTIASASWDGTIGIWPVKGGAAHFLKGHTAGVNDLAFSADGETLYSASSDGTIRLWRLVDHSQQRLLLRHGFGVNALALNTENGWLAYGAVDGVTRVIDPLTTLQIADFTLDRRPILAVEMDATGSKLAVGDGQGYITVIDTVKWKIVKDFRAAIRGPIWALAFSNDGTNIHAAGIEDIVYSWPLDNLTEYQPMAQQAQSFQRNPEKMSNGERQFARKCSICHALTPDGGHKAGPTLYRLFGRAAGTVEGYKYSDILHKAKFAWSEITVDQLFDLGPDHYIPGTKMPMQRIAAIKDRNDLIGFLRQATTKKDP